jgi:phytoene synthase
MRRHVLEQPRCATSADWRRCEAIAREHGRTFFLASRFLPPARRRAILAAYAYCRTADDIVDLAPTAGLDAVAASLARWGEQLAEPRDPIAVAFAAARARFAVPVEPVHDLLAGIRMDLTPARFASWKELREYCHLVAGTVGLIVAPILGCRDSRALEHAAGLGIAMQLTNILRDVAEDARGGRLYLPLDELEAFGCDPDAILAGRPGDPDRFAELMAFQIARARSIYAEARRGIPALAPSGRLTTLAASRLYGGILAEIEALDYDVFRTRARVPTARKLRALPGIVAAFARLTVAPARMVDPVRPVRQVRRPVGRNQPTAPVDAPLSIAGAPVKPVGREGRSYG